MTFNKKACEGISIYETPSVKSLDIVSEGVLCASGDFSIGDWENDDESLDF